MVIRIRDLLRAGLPDTLSLDDIADRLHLSPRTIHRRLEEEGSSFRGIKDALRRDMALARLSKTRDSIAQVAADLGYADTSAFYRAFVEWTGMAPVHYRRQWAGKSADTPEDRHALKSLLAALALATASLELGGRAMEKDLFLRSRHPGPDRQERHAAEKLRQGHDRRIHLGTPEGKAAVAARLQVSCSAIPQCR
jgi:AraC-like DNA-binding protein